MTGKSFKGNLEVLNLSDIFQSLAMNRHSGTLIVTDGKREKKIFFAEGEIKLLSSSRRQRLGDLLVASGKITEDDLDLALKLQKQSRKRLGEILVEEGFCEGEDIDRLVRQQIEEEIYDLFLWRRAEFEFIADQIPEDMSREAPNLTQLSLNTNSLIMEALRRLDEWNLIRNLVPSTKDVFVLTNAPGLESVDVPERIKVEAPEVIDGKTTVEGLADRFFVSEFELCKHLAELAQAGLVRALSRDELTTRAEECYVLNDFSGAAALYSRLAELQPDDPEILTPLADSLRRTGAEKQALAMYEQLAQQLESSGRDPSRLRQCYEAITQLDPTRQDLARKLEDLDLHEASGGRRRRVWPLVAGVVVAGLVAAGVVFRGEIGALFADEGPDPAETEEEAKDLLEAMTRAGLSGDPQREVELGWRLIDEYPRTPAARRVDFPVHVRTEPPGFEVYVNGLLRGVTSLEAPVLKTRFDPAKELHVEVEPVGGGDEALAEFRGPGREWHGEIAFSLLARPRGSVIGELPLDVGLVRSRTLEAYVAPSRDGTLRVVRHEGGGRFISVEGWDRLQIGEPGDRFAEPVRLEVDGAERLLVGATERGVVSVDLGADGGAPEAVSFPYSARGQVVARPLVVSAGEPLPGGRLVFGTLRGELLAYPLAGGEPAWSKRLDAPLRHRPALLPGRGLVVVAGGAPRVEAREARSGAAAWGWDTPALVAGPPLALGDDVVVELAGGRLVVLDGETGTPTGVEWTDPDGGDLRVLVEPGGGRVFVAAEGGVIRALASADLAPAWEEPVAMPYALLPRLALDGDRLVAAAGYPYGAAGVRERPGAVALLAESGQLVWQGRFVEARVNSPISVFDEGVFVGTTNSEQLFFDWKYR